jgi:hypothetical protein
MILLIILRWANDVFSNALSNAPLKLVAAIVKITLKSSITDSLVDPSSHKNLKIPKTPDEEESQ